MRKIYIAFLSLFALFFGSTKSTAQVSTYVFFQSNGTYTEISGGTVLGNTASDDQYFVNPADPLGTAGATTGPGFPIGFNFTYNGIVFDQFAVNNNGWISLGQSSLTPSTSLATTSAYTPLSSTAVNTPALLRNRIAGMGRDIQAQAGSELRFQTIGAAPNRQLVVQYKNYKRFGTGFVGDNFNFQIVLTETSNTVQVKFGAYVFNTVNTTSTVDHIGLGGTLSTDFNNRQTVAPHDWNTMIAGTTNAQGAQNATSTIPVTVPASGLTFTWLPPPPCVAGSLAGGTTQGPAGAQCPGASFDLTVTAASFGTGLTYQWESSTNNINWFPIVGATTQGLTTSTLVNTYYRRKMTCSGTDAYSSSLLITVSAPLPLPVNEGFNTSGTTVFPICWSQQYVVGTGNITFQTNTTNPTTIPFEGTRYAYWNSFSIGNNNETRLVSPAVVTTGTASVDVQFYWYNNNNPTYSAGQYLLEGVQVQYSLNGTTWTDAGSLILRHDASLASGTGQWKLKKVTLPAAAGNQPSILIGFKFHSGFGDNCSMDAVNILSTPACTEPAGLTVTNITATSATLNWTASPSNPSGGYQWEVRTSGAAGSGATGLAASGVTAAITANVAGLTANTAYTFYVRSDCGGASFSQWTAGVAFTTLCNAITVFPYTETFEVADPTRSCWKVNDYVAGVVDWIYATGGNGGAVTTAHGGSLNARFYQGNYNGNTTRLVSPTLNLSSMTNGAVVRFWFAQEVWAGDQDQMRVYYKTSAAGPWTLIPGAVYTSSVSQWTEIELTLPSSTAAPVYYVAFEGFGNFGRGVLIDDVTIEAAPTCPKPTAVGAVGVSPTSVIVNFTGPVGAYIVEYGAPGFVPGTTNTPGVGGTLVFSASSPINVNGLTANTTYDFYVRRICVPGVDYSVNTKVSATTLCTATNIPYLQNFETATPTAGFPTCTSMQDVNGNSGPDGNVTGGRWTTFAGTSNQTYVSPVNVLRYLYDLPNPARGADDWFYIQGLNLTGGTSYRLKFFYKASDGPTWIESLEVKYGTAAHSSAMTNLLYTNNSIATAIASPWDSASVDFTPVTNGVYYIGFHAISLPDQAFLYVDDISVKLAPLVDVGVSAIIAPTMNCPTNGVFLQATVTNYNTSAVNFATYPVTVTASITGAGTGTLTALLNAGILAPGASQNVYLSPAFNFSAGGIYNIGAKTATVTPGQDPETGNDSITTSITVNPNPPVPVITPPAAAICLGNPVQLSTQFTPPPPPSTITISSGVIAVNIPDNTPAGVAHTIAVNTIPAGASITGVSITIDKIAHTYDGDLIINVKAPNNKILNLFNQRGLGGDSLISTVITSAASAASLATGTAPFTGIFAPDANALNAPTGFDQNVTTFPALYNTGSMNGNWTLAVRDNAGLDVGILRGWTITITYQILTPTITWTPATGLYTNAGATTGYTGGNAFSLYANPTATTTYTVTATTAAGCSSSATATVTVNPYPVVTIGSIPDTVCTSDPLIPLVATPAGGTWTGIGVSGTNFVPPATAVGTYTLTYTYTNAFGCTTTATRKIAVKDCPERLILLRDNALLLYPNPNNGQFNIKINSVLYNNLVMKVYTNSGILVRAQQLGGLAWGRVVPIDLTNLAGGVYMVKFYYDGGVRTAEKTFKVIIGKE